MANGDSYEDQFRKPRQDNAAEKPEPISATVKISVLAQFVLALVNVFTKKKENKDG